MTICMIKLKRNFYEKNHHYICGRTVGSAACSSTRNNLPVQLGATILGQCSRGQRFLVGGLFQNPSGFTVAIYPVYGFPDAPASLGSSLGTLNGSADPSTAGVYSYTPTSSLTLLPNAGYFAVLTAGTAVADGAYELERARLSSKWYR